MITIKPKFDGSNGFYFITDNLLEKKFLDEHTYDILDKFVQSHFKNIGHLDIHTFKDYVNFCQIPMKDRLEMYEGHSINDFGKLEMKSAEIIFIEATKELAFTLHTTENLEHLANQMFEANIKNQTIKNILDKK